MAGAPRDSGSTVGGAGAAGVAGCTAGAGASGVVGWAGAVAAPSGNGATGTEVAGSAALGAAATGRAVGAACTGAWLGAVSVGLLSVVGHLVALIMFFPDAPGIAVALLALDLVVAVCLLALVRSTRSAPA